MTQLPLKDFKDLHLLIASMRAQDEIPDDTDAPEDTSVDEQEMLTPKISDDELGKILDQHELWLGYSEVKGWVLLDRGHPRYSESIRPFILLDVEGLPIETILGTEFGTEPQGPWKIHYWRHIKESAARGMALRKLFPLLKEYAEEIERRNLDLERCKEAQEADRTTTIRSLPDEDYPDSSDPEYAKKLFQAKRTQYGKGLPARVAWLKTCATQIMGGDSFMTNDSGGQNIRHLEQQGIHHLWHFTDRRSLPDIFADGGLVTWWGAWALEKCTKFWVASDYSRQCDLNTRRERYVRLSFIPNSRFFQKIRFRDLVWLRFPLDVLNVGNVFFTNGNAASNYAIMMNRVDRIFVNWRDNVIPVGGKYSDDKGPVHFIDPHSYCGFSRPIFNNWNSEILIEDFVPMEFCDGIYEAKTGEPVTCFHEQLKRVKARNG